MLDVVFASYDSVKIVEIEEPRSTYLSERLHRTFLPDKR